MKCDGVTNDGLTVATVTVVTTGVMPSEGVTDEGEIVQVDIDGAPPHANDTAALPDFFAIKLPRFIDAVPRLPRSSGSQSVHGR